MSLTSYRAAPPRVICEHRGLPGVFFVGTRTLLVLRSSGAALAPRYVFLARWEPPGHFPDLYSLNCRLLQTVKAAV